MTFPVIDLFCGVGGLTHGFIQEGFNVIAGYDIDLSCKYAYEKNNKPAKFIHKGIEDVTSEEIISLYPENSTKILVGCAPCQPFSPYTSNRPKDKKKWGLLNSFSELIKKIKPVIVSMENVPQLLNFGTPPIFTEFVNSLRADGYSVFWDLAYCPDYGIPQKRTRLVLLASQLGEIDLVNKTHSPENYKTVEQTIKHLSPIEAGGTDIDDPLHRANNLSDLNKRRIISSKPGGTWNDWPEELVAACHKKDTGQSYESVYGRMEWGKPSPTITAQCNGYGNGRFGHPEQNRAISLREAALLQTFPPAYDFIVPDTKVSIEALARHIGNAVPVDLGKIIAQSIKKHLELYNVQDTPI